MVDNKNTRKYGDRGEEYAVWFLKKRGYKVIERNFRSKVGEIDVIAVDPSTRSAKAQGRLERSRKATGHSTLRDKPLGSDSKSSGPDGTLAFVEVKTRWSKKYGKPEEAVTPRKLARIKRAGELYCLTHPGLPKKLRIDVVAIEVERGRVVSSKLIQVT